MSRGLKHRLLNSRIVFTIYIILVLFILLFSSCDVTDPVEFEPSDIYEKLRFMPGLEVTEIDPYYGYQRAFQIDMLQPVDHNNPDGQQFKQRIYLSHADESMPMVFAPSGYGSSPQSVQELGGILQTNHLAVVHRYFIDAEPNPMDWQYLTIRQAADDHHRIVELFKLIYNNVWVSSGVSKGGLTSLFHKRFYPDDVDATVAYVAPIELGAPDNRFIDFLKTVGTQECRDKIHDFQRRCLMNKDSLSTRIQKYFEDLGYNFTGDAVYTIESRVRSYDWNFWQYHELNCSDIPGPEATFDQMFNHLASASKLNRSSDELDYYFRPYYYQAYTELGYPGRNYDHLADLLPTTPDGSDQSLEDLYGLPVVYNPSTIQDIHQWLLTEGDNIIYIYGSIDPWTGGAIELAGQTNALKIMQEGGDHRIKIADLDEQALVLSTLEQWLGIEIGALQKRGVEIVVPDAAIELNYHDLNIISESRK